MTYMYIDLANNMHHSFKFSGVNGFCRHFFLVSTYDVFHELTLQVTYWQSEQSHSQLGYENLDLRYI